MIDDIARYILPSCHWENATVKNATAGIIQAVGWWRCWRFPDVWLSGRMFCFTAKSRGLSMALLLLVLLLVLLFVWWWWWWWWLLLLIYIYIYTCVDIYIYTHCILIDGENYGYTNCFRREKHGESLCTRPLKGIRGETNSWRWYARTNSGYFIWINHHQWDSMGYDNGIS